MFRLRMMSGDVRTFPFRVVDEAGTPIDISGDTPIAVHVFALSNGVPTGAAVFSDTLAGGGISRPGGAGLMNWAIAAADTASLSGRHYVEVRRTSAAGKLKTIGRGYLTIGIDIQ